MTKNAAVIVIARGLIPKQSCLFLHFQLSATETNYNRNLLPLGKAVPSVLLQNRTSLMLRSSPPLEGLYARAAEIISSDSRLRRVSRPGIGIDNKGATLFDYALWNILSTQLPNGMKVRYLNVSNPSASIRHNENFIPEYIITFSSSPELIGKSYHFGKEYEMIGYKITWDWIKDSELIMIIYRQT